MAPAANPKRLQVIDRIVAVLKTIATGDNYFYTPHEVVKGSILLGMEAKAYPTYMVHAGTGWGGTEEIVYAGDQQYDETFYPEIEGIVSDVNDVPAMIEKCIRDIRKAVNDDSVSGIPGTLGVLAVQVRIDHSPEIELGAVANAVTSIVGGFGWFSQKLRVQITGNYGEL